MVSMKLNKKHRLDSFFLNMTSYTHKKNHYREICLFVPNLPNIKPIHRRRAKHTEKRREGLDERD